MEMWVGGHWPADERAAHPHLCRRTELPEGVPGADASQGELRVSGLRRGPTVSRPKLEAGVVKGGWTNIWKIIAAKSETTQDYQSSDGTDTFWRAASGKHRYGQQAKRI